MSCLRILLACLAATTSFAAPAAAPRVTPEIENRQPALIDARIAAIATHGAPGSQVYFLGFAGYGEQRVFAEEINLAERRIAQRYGSAQRSLRLVNDRRDLEKYPLASVPALSYALKALGRVMDPDDVLFLAISSHGWKDATISISNVGMQEDALSARDLLEALRASGIQWKVIVLSACYSGKFISKLKDDHTIVLTAAAKNRSSFGCSDDRDLTYFGEAFYRDALPGARSLREAFERARAQIDAREKAEDFKPSHPQSFFGPLMEDKLAALEGVVPGRESRESRE